MTRTFSMDFNLPIYAYGEFMGNVEVVVDIDTEKQSGGIYGWEISRVEIGQLAGSSSLKEPSGEHYDSLIREVERRFLAEIDAEVAWFWEDEEIDGP